MTIKNVFIDGSYYIFFRYHALKNWWKLAKKDQVQDYSINNAEFVKKFKTLFISKFKEIFKKLKIDLKQTNIYVGKDCLRCDNWRNNHIENYKDGRIENKEIGDFFKMIYSENLFKNIPDINIKILDCHSLEADDCIALAVQKMYSTDLTENRVIPNKYIIITSDHDYGQLLRPDNSVVLYNLKYKNLCDGKKLFNDGKKNLFIKVCSGDKSDNISSIFPKCGFVTAQKMYDNPELLKKKISDSKIKQRFTENYRIIGFEYIPENLKQTFYNKYTEF